MPYMLSWETPVTVLFLSVALFGVFYGFLVRGVPRRYGISFQERLRRYYPSSAMGLMAEMLNAAFSATSSMLVIAESYDSEFQFLVGSFSADVFFSVFFTFHYFCLLSMAPDKLHYMLSLQPMIDLITVAPTYVALLVTDLNSSETGFVVVYRLLRITRVLRLVRLLRTFSFITATFQTKSTAARVIRVQFIQIGIIILVAITVLAGFFNFLVTSTGQDWGDGDGYMPFHNALYYTIITCTTLGYGDISPPSALGRLIVAAIVITMFFWLPIQASQLVYLLSIRARHGGKVDRVKGKRHIIVGCDPGCLPVMSSFLKELFLQEGGMLVPHVVLMVPGEPNQEWKALILEHAASEAITYLSGDLRSPNDLNRARAHQAHACFVLSDRYHHDTLGQDKVAFMRVVTVHEYNPNILLYCMLTHAEMRNQLVRMGIDPSHIVCSNRVMMKLLTHACLHPGFSTMVANLLTSMPEMRKILKSIDKHRSLMGDETSNVTVEATLLDTEVEYLKSLKRVVVRFDLGDHFVGERFSELVGVLYRTCGVTLFCLTSKDGQGGGVKLHPGKDYRIQPLDVGFLIIGSRHAVDRITDLVKSKTAAPKGVLGFSQNILNVLAGRKPAKPLPRHSAEGLSPRGSMSARGAVYRGKGLMVGMFGKAFQRMPDENETSPENKNTPEPGDLSCGGCGQCGQCRAERDSDRKGRRVSQRGTAARHTSSLKIEVEPDPKTPPQRGRLADLFQAGENGVTQPVTPRRLSPPRTAPTVTHQAPEGGHVVIITQCLSKIQRTTRALCEVRDQPDLGLGTPGDAGMGIGNGKIVVLCPFNTWNSEADELVEQEMNRSLPPNRVTIIKAPLNGRGLRAARVRAASLVCIASGQSKQDEAVFESDSITMTLFVEVLGLVGTSVRVVVELNDPQYAEQHEVLSSRVRRLAREHRSRQGRAHRKLMSEEVWAEEMKKYNVQDTVGGPGDRPRQEMPMSPAFTPPGQFWDPTATLTVMPYVAPGVLDGRSGQDSEYFRLPEGVDKPQFYSHFAIKSGYTSGDLVLGNSIELLLLQTYITPELVDVVDHLLASIGTVSTVWDQRSFVFRIPMPENFMMQCAEKGIPHFTYEHVFHWLLDHHDVLALGVQRFRSTDGPAKGKQELFKRASKRLNSFHARRSFSAQRPTPGWGPALGATSPGGSLGTAVYHDTISIVDPTPTMRLFPNDFLYVIAERPPGPLTAPPKKDTPPQNRRPSVETVNLQSITSLKTQQYGQGQQYVQGEGGHHRQHTVATQPRPHQSGRASPPTSSVGVDLLFPTPIEEPAKLPQTDGMAWAVRALVQQCPNKITYHPEKSITHQLAAAQLQQQGADSLPDLSSLPAGLSCQECSVLFTSRSAGTRTPLALGCGHLVCCACLDAMPQGQKSCPACQETVELMLPLT